MKTKAKKIRIEFNNSSGDYWEASCEIGLEFDEAIRMITRAWEEHDASAEPLIKDEKIRKAVRAWAEANGETMAKVKGACLVTVFKGLHRQLDLELNCSWTRDGVYTIEELCGTPEPIELTFIDLDERIKEKEEE